MRCRYCDLSIPWKSGQSAPTDHAQSSRSLSNLRIAEPGLTEHRNFDSSCRRLPLRDHAVICAGHWRWTAERSGTAEQRQGDSQSKKLFVQLYIYWLYTVNCCLMPRSSTPQPATIKGRRPPFPFPPSQATKGTKNSFPGLTTQPAQSPAEQRESFKPGKSPSFLPKSSEASSSEGDNDFAAGEWLSQRTRDGKAARKLRELPHSTRRKLPGKQGKQASTLVQASPPPTAEQTAASEGSSAQPVEVLDSSSGSDRAPPSPSKLTRRTSRAVRAASPLELNSTKAQQATPSENSANSPPTLPDFIETNPALKRTVGFIACHSNPSDDSKVRDPHSSSSSSDSSSDSEISSSSSGQENKVQGCAPPPGFGEGSSDDSDSSVAGSSNKKSNNKAKFIPKSPPVLTASKPNSLQAKKPSQRSLKPIDNLLFEAVLAVHSASDKGDCLFDSLTSSLGYILEHHPSSYNLSRFPQSRKTLQTFCNNLALRNALVDHVVRELDVTHSNLGGLTPAEAIIRDYIEGEQPLHDPEWYERICSQTVPQMVHLLPQYQIIKSVQQYIDAMRKPFAHGDEIMLAMFCDLFNLRVVVAELTEKSCSVKLPNDHHVLAHVSLDIFPQVPLSSDFTVTLIMAGAHYDWAHLSRESCNDPAAHCTMGPATHVACHTTTQIVYCDQDPDMFTPVCHNLMQANTRRNRRAEVMTCLVDECGAVPTEAELTLSTFEKLGGIASMTTLPELLHLHKATTYKPETDNTHASCCKRQADKDCNHNEVTARVNAVKRPSPSRHVQSNELKRATSAQERLDANPAVAANTEEPADLLWAVNAVKLVTNCSDELAMCTVKHNHSKTLNYVQAVTASCQQISAIISAPAAPIAAPAAAPTHRAPQTFNEEISFVERHLGEGVREMTQAELAIFAAAERALAPILATSTAVPPMSSIVPKNLNHYWQHHLTATASTPRGTMTAEQHATAVSKVASKLLHYEACNAASAKHPPQILPEPAQAVAEPLPQDFQTPQQSRPLQVQPALIPLPITAPDVPAPPAQNYLAHASPAVRMAATRAAQAQSARSSATTVVVMASNQSKLLQWKAGSERECKGFYWSTKLAVQQAWEQYNTSEDAHSYRTFKSAIHCTMLPIVCAELSINREQFDKISDAELIDLIDKKLKPTGPADYLIKMRQIKFDTTEPSTTSLLHRYRAFAEPFLQLLAEATEAGCPINEESAKLAFKEQCRGSNLMMMWLQEDRWLNAAAAHTRIMTHLKNYNTLVTLQSLNGHTLSQPPAPQAPQAQQQQQAAVAAIQQQQQAPAAVAAQPAQQQQPYYSPQQRADYKRQKMLSMQPAVQVFQPQAPQAPLTAQQAAPAPVHPIQQSNPFFQPQRQQQAQANPLFQPQQPLQANNMMSPPQSTQPPYVQPGLDHRGPHWHPIGSKCRFSPCNSHFCQGCGEHGHSVQDCKKRGKHANWNYSGYYSEQRPGQGPLIYDGPTKLPLQFPAPAAQQPPAAPAPPFPTPHTHVARPVPPPPASPNRNYTPVVRTNFANAANQHPDGVAAAGQQ